jgi:hypothetical protein
LNIANKSELKVRGRRASFLSGDQQILRDENIAYFDHFVHFSKENETSTFNIRRKIAS